VVAGGLLDVNIFPRLAGPNGHEGMPVVGRGDRDRVERLVLQGLADVLNTLGRREVLAGERAQVLGVGAGVGVDEVGDLHVLHAGPGTHVASAAAVESGDGDADGVVGAEHAAGGLGAGDGYQGAGAGGLEEVTASRERHGESSFVGV